MDDHGRDAPCVTYDAGIRTAYVHLVPDPHIAMSVSAAPDVSLDFDGSGAMVGIEVTHGAGLVPDLDETELREHCASWLARGGAERLDAALLNAPPGACEFLESEWVDWKWLFGSRARQALARDA